MQASRSCKSCGGKALAVDDVTGNTACTKCGVVQDFDNFQSHFGGITGPTGSIIRIGTAGSGTVSNYKDSKIYHAKNLIEDLTFKLGLSGSKSQEVKELVGKITDWEYGEGIWFPVLVGACAYVLMREDNKTLPIVTVADVVGCDVHELGKMFNRVVEFMELKLPEFDYVGVFEHAVRNGSFFLSASKDMVGRVLQQGVLLMQCLVKWFVTTGRRPIPVVSAVLVFIAELNGVILKIEEVANEFSVALSTCKKRYREILEKFVDVAAKVLPWGKDVTLKNVVMNAPFVMQYLEMKTMRKGSYGERRFLEGDSFDFEGLIAEFSSEGLEHGYGYGNYGCSAKESRYFEIENSSNSSFDSKEKILLSPEALSMVYSNHLDEISMLKASAGINVKKKSLGQNKFNLQECMDWWRGKSDMSKKLLLKELLQKDIGFEAMPPSFDHGCLAEDQRREKIAAAKIRINKIMHPNSSEFDNNESTIRNLCPYEPKKVTKKRKRSRVDIDWEDLIIETLLLHNVKEEEIVKGHYNVLLDLHVFCHSF